MKNIGILILALILTFLTAYFFGLIFHKVYPIPPGFDSFIAPSSLSRFFDGFISAYAFFIFILFIIFGDVKKYWWIGIALLPAVLFEVVFDLRHIYFPIVIGLTGWLLAQGVLAVKVRVGK